MSGVDPRSYLGLLSSLGVGLEPGQEALARVAFDGQAVASLPEPLTAPARALFGAVGELPAGALRRLAVVAGARSGKTYLFSLRLLHLALTVDVSRCAPGEQPAALIIAPSKRLGRQALRYIKGAVDSKKLLRGAVVDSNADTLTIKRAGGRTVRIEVAAAKAGGEAGRGFSLVGALMDEASFFRDEDYAVNDVEVWRAIKARIIMGGQAILSSTPWARSGLLYDTYKQQWAKPETFLVAHAATRTMRTDTMILEQVAAEERDDPDNARREFGAEFLGLDASTFFAEDLVGGAIDTTLELGGAPLGGDEVIAGADFGFRRNSSALAIVHKRGDRYILADLVEVQPEDDEPLKPSAVCATFADVLARHGCGSVVADQHYIESVREHLNARGISVSMATAKPDEVYVKARDRFRERRLALPSHRRLLAQLKEIRARPTVGGGLSMQLPKKPDGSHADLVAALTLALWQSHGQETARVLTREESEAAWLERQEDRMEARLRAETEKAWWDQ